MTAFFLSAAPLPTLSDEGIVIRPFSPARTAALVASAVGIMSMRTALDALAIMLRNNRCL